VSRPPIDRRVRTPATRRTTRLSGLSRQLSRWPVSSSRKHARSMTAYTRRCSSRRRTRRSSSSRGRPVSVAASSASGGNDGHGSMAWSGRRARSASREGPRLRRASRGPADASDGPPPGTRRPPGYGAAAGLPSPGMARSTARRGSPARRERAVAPARARAHAGARVAWGSGVAGRRVDAAARRSPGDREPPTPTGCRPGRGRTPPGPGARAATSFPPWPAVSSGPAGVLGGLAAGTSTGSGAGDGTPDRSMGVAGWPGTALPIGGRSRRATSACAGTLSGRSTVRRGPSGSPSSCSRSRGAASRTRSTQSAGGDDRRQVTGCVASGGPAGGAGSAAIGPVVASVPAAGSLTPT
jgi:hypothetical protein